MSSSSIQLNVSFYTFFKHINCRSLELSLLRGAIKQGELTPLKHPQKEFHSTALLVRLRAPVLHQWPQGHMVKKCDRLLTGAYAMPKH